MTRKVKIAFQEVRTKLEEKRTMKKISETLET